MEPINPTKKTFKEVFWQLVIAVIIGTVFVVIATVLVKSISPQNINKSQVENIVNDVIKEKLVKQPACANTLEEYSTLKGKGQSLQVVSALKSHAVNGQLVGSTKATIAISGKDDVACGYLYIRASKNGKPLDEKYDSVYINPQDFGGHILRPKGILARNTASYTEALISLNAVAYLPKSPYDPDAQNFRLADWAKLLNVNSHVTFSLGLSTLDRSGLIEDVSIAYKCWDTETGDETSNCQLSL